MPLRRTAPRTHATRATTTRPSLKTRLLGPKRAAAPARTHHTKTRHSPRGTTTVTTKTTTKTTRHHGPGVGVATHHQKRHATMGDKVSGALMKLKGTLTGRPGVKAAGTRRMHGTDGRRARRARI
ncbi:hypothetical protein M011DRAFT_269887 [Sporormia fimetaria CBS 119925]|uniref:Uncharacterized protein n=1 Tax=Sporormia fimetaria CBS 119925 TaxID=1340428 RepID=A0A6A6UXC9_9PLEO|nr:hypothetical protein M011DRAFT_269887 [Sporormia fimetaria CBS 119925]